MEFKVHVFLQTQLYEQTLYQGFSFVNFCLSYDISRSLKCVFTI